MKITETQLKKLIREQIEEMTGKHAPGGDDYRTRVAALEKSYKEREAAGLLPLVVDSYGGEPDPRYYKSAGNVIHGPDGFSSGKYRLRPQYKDKKVSPEVMEVILGGARAIIDV